MGRHLGKSSEHPGAAASGAADAGCSLACDAMTQALVVVGGGNMGAALVAGLLAAGREVGELGVVEVVGSRRDELTGRFPGLLVAESTPPCTGAVIAVKPPDAPGAAGAAVAAGATRVLSIAAGVTLAQLESACGPGVAVIRAMPNTPALVGQGAAAISPGRGCDDRDVDWAEQVLSAVGTVVRVPESSLDAVTGLSGSGPAYLFLVAEAMMDAGVAVGLPRATSEALVRQLFVGSAALLAGGDPPAVLRAGVTSPAGTTVAGLHALESHAVRAAFLDAVAAAAARSRQLGE